MATAHSVVCSFCDRLMPHALQKECSDPPQFLEQKNLRNSPSSKTETARTQSKALVKKSVNKRTGQVQVTGQKRMLEASAHYPVSFGLAVAGLINPVGAPAPRPASRLIRECPRHW